MTRSPTYWNRRISGSKPAVWLVKHMVAPVDRHLLRLTGGRVSISARRSRSVLLLTTTGRRTGAPRTTPVFYLRDGARLVICNVNPGFERTNPWVLNLRRTPVAQVQIGSDVGTYRAREATAPELERLWPRLVTIWPAYQAHFERSGERTVFVLEPE